MKEGSKEEAKMLSKTSKFHKAMSDYGKGEMHSGIGGKKGARKKEAVTNPAQAEAIAFSQARTVLSKDGYKKAKEFVKNKKKEK